MTDLWKIINRLEEITDHIEKINDNMITYDKIHSSISDWILQATENIQRIETDINYLKHKKDAL